MVKHTYTRVDLAKEQLEVALSLFLDQNSYAATITLAGAAEEILGKELVHQKKQPVLEWKFDQMGIFHKLLHGKDLTHTAFFAEENRIRNALKHFDKTEDSVLVADLADAACWLLVRACENAQRLGIELGRFQEFDNWFYENMAGI